MITVKQKGDYSKVTRYFERFKNGIRMGILDEYGKKGVAELSKLTPKDTGVTAASWYYKVTHEKGRASIEFHNDNINNGVQIVMILQYGHATRNGGWVQGRDFINPAIKPIFEELADAAWKEVSRV